MLFFFIESLREVDEDQVQEIFRILILSLFFLICIKEKLSFFKKMIINKEKKYYVDEIKIFKTYE